MKQLPQIIFIIMIIICTGSCGVLIGQNMAHIKDHGTSNDMHFVFHDQLNVTAQQEEKLIEIEKKFKRLKNLYQGRMRTANMELAQAIKEGGYQSPEIENSVHNIHESMGALQGLSLQHLADMQDVLSEDQGRKLQEMVVEQLYRNAGE
ncbi:MAG: hypothetical protein COA45_07070 [Zetaproteobacteria bacterium]|nr:MAG: hypothetical protein COA45_07070 [Zetaproteobacteria bacterium]